MEVKSPPVVKRAKHSASIWPSIMAFSMPYSLKTRSTLVACIVISFLVFIFDSVTDPNINASMLYVLLIYALVRTKIPIYILNFSIYTSILTVVSYCISPGLTTFDAAWLADLGLSLFMIFATGFMGLKIIAAEAAAQKAQANIARTMRGMSLAELGISIAHELNQPLAATVASAAAAKRWLDLSPSQLNEARSAIAATVRNAERAGEIVHGLRRLVSRGAPNHNAIDVAILLSETLDLVHATAVDRGVYIETSIPRNLPVIWGDRVLVQQAILNLLSNALDALDRVGPQTRTISVLADLRDRQLAVVITDTGPGMPPDAAAHLFEPFHSTKPNGLGIGLALTRSIAEAHGGSVKASHGTPQGMRFEISFSLCNVPGTDSLE